jgi:SAM-dependent methyltransferase
LEKQWFETFFRGVAVDCWRRFTTPEWTSREVDFIENQLGLPDGARLLDVPCGHGRHSIEFAERGYVVTGIDLSEECLAAARETRPAGEWRRGDMRSLQLEAGEYDGAYCWGNSFGYLPHADACRFLASVASALKPRAPFLLDTPTVAEAILPDFERAQWHRTGDMFLLGETHYVASESRMDIEYTFVNDGRIETRPTSSYVFTAGEIKRMVEGAGFDVAALYGSTSGEEFVLGARGLIVKAVKRA